MSDHAGEGWPGFPEKLNILLGMTDQQEAARVARVLSDIPDLQLHLYTAHNRHALQTEMRSNQYDVCFLAHTLAADDILAMVKEDYARGMDLPVILLLAGDPASACAPIHRDSGVLEAIPAEALGAALVKSVLHHAWSARMLVREVRKLKQTINRISGHDLLTGIFNRQYFEDVLPSMHERAHRLGHALAILHIDIDQFRRINAMHGHPSGDRLLQQVARRIQGVLRKMDTLCRLGGDEFAVLCEGNLSRANLSELARRIIDVLGTPFFVNDRPGQISASIGITLLGKGENRDAQSLLREADIAMYCAKRNGRNNWQFYSEDFLEEFLEYTQISAGLQYALENEEMSLCYQPLIALSDGKPNGVEALLRWNHPVMGDIEPRDFIPIAEKTGLVVPIGEWVLREACKQKQRWEFGGFPHLRVAVNVSIRQLQLPDFADTVQRIIRETGIDPTGLELEVAETALSSDREACKTCMHALHALGVHLVIDDFGTGYSNLGYIKDFPFDKIKIDKLFIDEIAHQGNERHIVKAIIGLAKSLHLEVVAEGVETAAQVEYLRKHHGDQIQGYYFSRPLSAEDCTQFLSRV